MLRCTPAWLLKLKSIKALPIYFCCLERSYQKGIEELIEQVEPSKYQLKDNGLVEGHINRLKMLKQQMYGRAGIDLLSRRFLLTTSRADSIEDL